jgi:hypothetical protein
MPQPDDRQWHLMLKDKLCIFSHAAIKLSKKSPSPAGEGWGEENKINNLNSPHPNLLLYALWVLWRRGVFLT